MAARRAEPGASTSLLDATMGAAMQEADYPLPGPLVTVSPDWLGGEPCFTGRRVPIKALFDHLKSDHSLEEFLDAYPSVSRAHAVAVIDLATESVARPVAAE
jgi:uncharacterized protein (DUF433 family)